MTQTARGRDGASRRKLRGILAIVLTVVIFAGMVAYNAMRPDPAAVRAQEISSQILATNPEDMSEAERDAMRQQWQALDPETRRQVMATVAKARLGEMRDRMAGLTPEERSARVQESLEKMRQGYAKMSDEERVQAKERLSSEDGQEMVMTIMEFFENDFTARERAELDPLVREWIRQINDIVGQ